MLRITRVNPGEQPVILRLEGRLRGPWVEELRRVVRLSGDDAASLVLDLGDVSFADAAGAGLLRDLQSRGAAFRGATQFLIGLVRGESDECA